MQTHISDQELPEGSGLRRLGHMPLGATIVVLGLGLFSVFRALLRVGGGIG